MADVNDVPHVWFIPVTGGRGPGMSGIEPFRKQAVEPFNVQWNSSVYPVNQEPTAEESCVQSTGITSFVMGYDIAPNDEPSRLSQCHGTWTWRSCKDGSDVVVGGQLAVGTVFSKELPVLHGDTPHNTYLWNIVEVFAKYRVDDKNKLDHIWLTLCDSGPNRFPVPPFGDDWGNAVNNQWGVAGLCKRFNWQDWDEDNLRVVLNFQGTTSAANVGKVTCDVEWFAFRLSHEEE